jgi:DNA polymerase
LVLTQQKDSGGGRRILQRVSVPRKPRKGEDPKGIYWNEDKEDLAALGEYCKQDVATEYELYRKIGFLSDAEQDVWVLDQIINDRGIHVDRSLAIAANQIVEQARTYLDKELCEITDGAVGTVHQCARLQQWLADNGCRVEDLNKGTLRRALTRMGLSEKVRRAIEIRLEGARASTSKLNTILAWAGIDDRLRGCFKMNGAKTGRWASNGAQVHNFPRQTVDDLDPLIEAVSAGDIEHVRQACALPPMEVVSAIMRAVICAAPGHRFVIGDFSGIESRVLAWLAGQTDKLELWANFDRTGALEDDPYYRLGIKYGFPPEQARALGKICDLAFGYMGGEGAWRNLSPDDGLTIAQIKAHQQAWRSAHPYVVALWKALDIAAVRAVQNPFKPIKLPRLAWQALSFKSDGVFLRMYLPSGRSLTYPFPEVRPGKFDHPVVVFKEVTLGKWGDCRHGQGAYGGTWIENAVQAVARDILAEAMLRLEAAGYKIVAHVHDEIVAEVPDGFGSVEEFQKLITIPPAWAT